MAISARPVHFLCQTIHIKALKAARQPTTSCDCCDFCSGCAEPERVKCRATCRVLLLVGVGAARKAQGAAADVAVAQYNTFEGEGRPTSKISVIESRKRCSPLSSFSARVRSSLFSSFHLFNPFVNFILLKIGNFKFYNIAHMS